MLSPVPRDTSVSALRAKDIPTRESKFQLIDSDKFELKNTILFGLLRAKVPRQRPFVKILVDNSASSAPNLNSDTH